MKLSPSINNLKVRVINTETALMVVIMFALSVLSALPARSQNGMIKPSKAEAQAAWDRGDYDRAFIHYNGLLLLYTRDPLYQYYTGACLVKLHRDTERAVTLLSSAINSSVNIKSVPDAVWFYYGRSLQMSGSFSQAIEAYNRFNRLAGRKVAMEYNVQTYIDQCNSGVGVVKSAGTSPQGTEDRGSSGKAEMPAAAVEEPKERKENVLNERKPGTPLKENPAGLPEKDISTGAPVKSTTAGAPVKSTTAVSPEKSTPAGAPVKSTTAGSPVKDDVRKVTRTDKAVVRGDISNIPGEQYDILGKAVELQNEADSLSDRAERMKRTASDGSPGQVTQTQAIAAADSAAASEIETRADSLLLGLGENRINVTTEPVVPESAEPEVIQLTWFEVISDQAYSIDSPVPVEPAMPEGLVYTIQIAAFRNNVSPSLFRGLRPVFGKKRSGSDATYYYTGIFRRLDDARQALPEARSSGFPDAFIIAMMNGTQVSLDRAAQLEKEWGSRPLPRPEDTGIGQGGFPTSATSLRSRSASGNTRTGSDLSGTAGDSGGQVLKDAANNSPVPLGTLSFRAEVMRVAKPVKPEMIEKLETLAGTRGLDMIKNSDGETVFLIGNFITFESADEYVSLLVRNGYSAARVAAWVGTQEIPVEAAKELLKKLPDD